ncbi:MAG TPA: Clp protease N-terminal domain-containing protein [Marmoricola sp.]|nr:Clp protease N-terminal domain-containing protein [Marmoricola sp.]
MFERFSKEARAVVVGAQDVARDTGTRSIDTRHLLTVLVESPGPVHRALQATGADVEALAERARADLRAGGIDGDALAGIGIDLDAVRRQTDAVFGAGALERAGRTRAGHIPFTRDAKKALELALREAIRLRQKSILTGHLMLGILRAESPGRALLRRVGIDTDALVTALEEQTRAA